MRVLIADDNTTIRRAIAVQATSQGFDPVCCADGQEAYEIMTGSDAPPLAILDWEMPKLEGPEVCRKIREACLPMRPYIMVVTVKLEKKDVVAALDAGADDYLGKPFSVKELAARMNAGRRLLEEAEGLRYRIAGLEEAVTATERVMGLLPKCPSCHRIRDGQDKWLDVDTFLARHPEVDSSEQICPECLELKGCDLGEEDVA